MRFIIFRVFCKRVFIIPKRQLAIFIRDFRETGIGGFKMPRYFVGTKRRTRRREDD